MSEPRKHHLVIDGAQVKEDEQNIGLYKAIPENDTDFRTSKSSLHKSREKASIDGAEEKLLSKEDEAKIVTRVDMADAKYVVGDHRNGDAKIELDANKRQFTGLTKEELLKYADDPFWVRLRWFMFVLFWALWLAMLAGAIAIIVTAPKCAAPEPKAWFEKGPIIDMEKGLLEISSSDLEKLKEINPEAIYVDVDTPYDILDSGADVAKFKDIIAQAKDVKVILDMSLTSVPTSHRWFSLSANRTPEYETYFIWASPKEYNGTEPLPPNKWVSTFNTSAWRWSDARSQFYLQQTTAGEADLNLTDSRVRAQAGDVIAKWIGLGAAGIRLVNARELLIDPTLADEVPASGAAARASDHTQYGFWRHARASDQPGLAQLLAEWASVVRTSAKTDYPAVLTTEERGDRPEYFLSAHNNTSALRPRTARVVLGADSAAAAKAIGDRLGTWPALKLWSPSNNSELAAWSLLLPATPVLTLRDFTVQNNSDGESLVHLLRLRSDVSVQHGEFIVSAVPARNRSDTLLAVARWKAGHTGYAGVYNTLPTAARADLRSLRSVPDTVSVLYVSADVRADTNYTTNLSIPSDDVLVPSQSSVLLSYVPVITPVE